MHIGFLTLIILIALFGNKSANDTLNKTLAVIILLGVFAAMIGIPILVLLLLTGVVKL